MTAARCYVNIFVPLRVHGVFHLEIVNIEFSLYLTPSSQPTGFIPLINALIIYLYRFTCIQTKLQ